MLSKITKANGHIVQSDWNQTDPKQFDYIHNKPEIPSIDGLASEDFVDTQVNKLYKKIVTRNCEITTEQLNVQINVYEPLDTDGTATNYFGVAFPISIPEQFIGQDISVSIDDITLGDVAVDSSITSEYIGIANSKEEYFTDFDDSRCLASNDGSGWTTNEVTHNVQSTSAYLMLYFVTPIPADQLDSYRLKYSDKLNLTYSIKTYTEVGDDYIYDKDLHSNLETHYEHPIDETAFQNFIMSYDQNIAQEWVIYFKAAATDIFDRFSTVNIVSNNGDINSIEVCWIGSKPKCLLNKQYKVTFKIINEKLYGLLEFLEEQPIEITENTDLRDLLVPGTYFYDSARSLTFTNKPSTIYSTTSFNLSVKYLGYNTANQIATFTQEINTINTTNNTKYVAKLLFDTTTNTISTTSAWQSILATSNAYYSTSQGGTGSSSVSTAQKNLGIYTTNFLLNGNFQVNQRATSTAMSYSTVGEYCVDRWKLEAGSVSWARYTNYITLAAGTTISQTLDLQDTFMLIGQPLSIGFGASTSSYSYPVNSAGVGMSSVFLTSSSAKTLCKTGNALVLMTLNWTSESTIKVSIQNIYTTAIRLYWAQLFPGKTANVNFVPRTYAEELLACQRYFQVIQPYEMINTRFTGDNYAELYLNLTTPMRATPTITMGDQVIGTYFGAGQSFDMFNTQVGNTINSIDYVGPRTILITMPEQTNYSGAWCFGSTVTQAPLYLDAEIY